MTIGTVIRPHWIASAYVTRMTNTLFLFGDNMVRRGLGGQAKAMRGKPNAVGVPTKWFPAMSDKAFFRDTDLSNPLVKDAIDAAFDKAAQHLKAGGDVVIPADGLGTGLACLPDRAPRIHDYIEGRIRGLVGLQAFKEVT